MTNKLLAISRLKPGQVKTFQIRFALQQFAAGCDIDKLVGTYCVLYATPTGFQAQVQQFANSPSGCQEALAWVLSHAQQHMPPGEKPLFIIESTGCYHQLSVKTFNDATEVAELKDGAISRYSIQPEDFGMRRSPLSTIQVAGPEQSLALIASVLNGEPGAARDIVQLNAGAAIYAAGVADSLQQGVERAAVVIDDGSAKQRLTQLVDLSQSFDQ